MGEPDSNTRNSEVSGMLDYAFANLGLKKVLSKNSVVKKISLSKAKQDEIKIVPIEDVNVLYKKMDGEINPTYDVKINDIKVPIKNGDIVGKIYVRNNDEIINEVNLTVSENIDKTNLIELYIKNLKNIISGNIKFT